MTPRKVFALVTVPILVLIVLVIFLILGQQQQTQQTNNFYGHPVINTFSNISNGLNVN